MKKRTIPYDHRSRQTKIMTILEDLSLTSLGDAQKWSSIFIWINASYGRIRFVAIHEKMLYEV